MVPIQLPEHNSDGGASLKPIQSWWIKYTADETWRVLFLPWSVDQGVILDYFLADEKLHILWLTDFENSTTCVWMQILTTNKLLDFQQPISIILLQFGWYGR
jgi:hypothetical protein